MEYKDLPKWFRNRIETVMKHNDFEESWITVEECDKVRKWTPVDLMLREEYNNGSGSAKGFLGLTPSQNRKCYEYIREHQKELKELDLYNKDGFNNFGFSLWTDYHIH